VQWQSDKPATAKAEITIRFGSSLGDVNIVGRASLKADATGALTNAKKSGQTYSEADVSQFALTTVNPAVLLRDAPRDAALLFTTNVTFLHVEVSCPTLSNPLACTLNDDMKVEIDFKLADGPCWFKNLCSHIGTPQQTKCIDFGATGYECACADGFASMAQQSGPPQCVATTAATGASGANSNAPTVGPTKDGVPATTAGPMASADMTNAANTATIAGAAFVVVLLLLLQ
jgi:hypothetical protein